MTGTNTEGRLWRWLRGKDPSVAEIADTPGEPPRVGAGRIIDDQGDDWCGVSDVGTVREANEDMFLLSPEHRLLIVADGLGGHEAGEVASAVIVRAVYHAVAKEAQDKSGSRDVLADAFWRANEAVREYTTRHPRCRGMGATLVVALIDGNQATVGHVGDTRCYVSQGGRVRRLTNDHTTVGRLLRANLLTEDEARGHPARNVVSQAVMGDRDVRPDFIDVDLVEGDRLMLCSDGLWDEVRHGEIEKILAGEAPACEIALRLVDEAIAAGGNDNVTSIVYRHHSFRPDMTRGADAG